MFDVMILALVIVFLVVGLSGLLSFSKPCKSWKIVAKARVVSKIRYVSALGFHLIAIIYLVGAILSKGNLSYFDLTYSIAMIFIGFLWILDHSKAEIAEEGIIIGRIVKVCICWEKFKDIKIEENSIKVGRYLLEVEGGLNVLNNVLKF